jgi:preprotein translocase subunit YajC
LIIMQQHILLVALPAAQAEQAPPFTAQPAAPAGANPGNATGTTAAPGTPAGTTAPPRGGLDFITLALFGVVLALIVSSFLGARREKKKFEEMMSSIKKNDQVRTASGIIGSVVEVKPDVVVLKVDENSNTKITVVRSKNEAVIKESTTGAA